MYKNYKFDISSKSVWVTGDIHGEFNLLRYKIKESGLIDSLIIVAGDCGFGFEKLEYYKQVYNKLKKILDEQNVTLIFVRGNHDNPELFDGKTINYKRFIAIPDYSIISTNEDNILCVGGAISIDRIRRIPIKYNKFIKKKYWENEPPIYNPDILRKISSDSIDINVVVTHTSPTFAPLLTKDGVSYWILMDKNLAEDLDNERQTLTKLYNHLINESKCNIRSWFYGHFHQHANTYSEHNVNFIMLDRLRTDNNSWDICPIKR